MQVRISPEREQKINRLAAQQGRDSDSLVQEALERFGDYDQWFLREVEKGLAQAERAEFDGRRRPQTAWPRFVTTSKGAAVLRRQGASPLQSAKL